MTKNKNVNSVFDIVLKITNFYIALLAIFGFLVTIGLLPLRSKPQIKILKPIYIYNMAHFMNTVDKYKLNSYYPYEDKRNELILYGAPESLSTKKMGQYYLPFEYSSNPNFHGWSSFTPHTMWYLLGISDSSDNLLLSDSLNYSAYRSDEAKRMGISLLFITDYGEEATKSKLTTGRTFITNPLEDIYKLRNENPSLVSDNFILELLYATKVYSIISISNQTQRPMENIRLLINEAVNSGLITVVGYTSSSFISQNNTNSPNICLNIDRIESGQSIEVLVKGSKLIRQNDIKISMPFLSAIRNDLVIVIMVVLLVVVIVFYCFSHYRYP